jgi:hypothetical protein
VSRKALAVIVLAALGLDPSAARAWGIPGCANLPEYNRALGALQGMTSACDMSVEEARRVIAAHDGVAPAPPVAAQPPAAPSSRLHQPHRGQHPRGAAHRRERRPS